MAHTEKVTLAVALITVMSLFSLAAAGADNPATASTADTNQLQLTEIVVTAQKREQNLQKIPSEIVAVSADQLATQDIQTAADLVKTVPGLAFANTGANPIIFIRGIGGAAASPLGDPGIAFNIDGVNYSRPQGATGAFFDLSRVEILKGPQGTLYGRNTAGGAFNVVSNDPVFHDEGTVGLEVGNYAEFSTNAMANIELNDDLALRVAFKTLRHTGYLSLGYSDADDVAGRVKLLWKPGDIFSVKWTTSYTNKGGKGAGDVPISAVTGSYLNPANPWEEYLSAGRYPNVGYTVPADGHESTKLFSTQLDINWQLGFANFTVVPAYVLNTHVGLQYDAGFYQLVDEYSKQDTLEARLSSNASSPVTWVAGVYYLKEDEHYSTVQQLQNLGPVFFFERDSSPDVAARSTALFGQATYPIIDPLRVTVGLRGTIDKKSVTATASDNVVAPTQPVDSTYCTTPADACKSTVSGGEKTFRSFNFKAGLDYDLTATSLLYANVATGTKPGGFDINNFVGPYKEEKVTTYTLGSKNRFLDNTLQINAEAFYNNYVDLDANGFAWGNPPGFGPLPSNSIIAFTTINVPKSYTTGLDLSTDYLLTPNDRLSLNAEYLVGKFKEFYLPGFAPVGQVATNYSGLVKDRSPKWSGNASYNHTLPLPVGKLVAGVDESFATTSYVTFQRSPPGSQQPGFGLTDAQLSYFAPADKWTLGFHINNVTNKAVLTDALASPGVNPRGNPATAYWGSPLAPRTYAVYFQYNM